MENHDCHKQKCSSCSNVFKDNEEMEHHIARPHGGNKEHEKCPEYEVVEKDSKSKTIEAAGMEAMDKQIDKLNNQVVKKEVHKLNVYIDVSQKQICPKCHTCLGMTRTQRSI